MSRFVGRLRALALALGAPGLFLIAFLDSSFLSLPEIADILVVYMVTKHKSRMLLYVASTLLGSLAGCLVMYFIGLKGGEALVRKRFAGGAVEKARAALQRHGIMTVLIPSILPPPAPFKIFVLLAGAAGIRVGQFTAAILIGRGARYLLLGLLAVRYGDRTMTYVEEHALMVSLVTVGILAVGFFGYLAWSKAQAAKSR
jgi:membrane protein YqaA with SNARE-associated domain